MSHGQVCSINHRCIRNRKCYNSRADIQLLVIDANSLTTATYDEMYIGNNVNGTSDYTFYIGTSSSVIGASANGVQISVYDKFIKKT